MQADRGQSVADEIHSAGGRALFTKCDVGQSGEVRASIEQTVREFGSLSTIVNCAGIVQVKLLHELDEADWDRLMAINLKSIYLSIKHGIGNLKRNAHGYVVNIGSISSYVGQGSTGRYILTDRARAAGDSMTQFYGQVIVSLIQRAAILYDTTVLKRPTSG